MFVHTKLYTKFDLETDFIFDSQFHPEEMDTLGFATIEGSVQIVKFAGDGHEVRQTFKRHHKGAPIRRVRFHKEHMLTAARVVKVTDLNAGKVLRKLEAPDVKKLYSLLVVDDYLVCAGDDEGRFLLWDYRVERPIHMNVKNCEDHISDLDIDSRAKTVVASCGEGTLTAFDVRAMKMLEPQSELFDSGFTSVAFLEEKEKVVTATEDGVINIFNIGGWGNISDRFPANQNNSGECSIDQMRTIDDDEAVFVMGCSDGKLQCFSLFPHKICNTIVTEASGIETLDVNQISKQIVSTVEGKVKVWSYDIIKEEHKVKKLKKSESFYSELEN